MTSTQTGYMVQEALFEASWLPEKPLCAPAKDAPYKHRSRAIALDLPYIESNPLCKQSMIITDVDSHDVAGLAELVGLPRESWAVRTANEIGTGHIGYALHTPVCLTDAARRRPINLLSRVELGIRDVLGGDIGYSGRIMKNPVSPGPYQETLWADDPELDPFPTYGLTDLARALNLIRALPDVRDPRPRKASGVGRNVDVFDRTRTWSYRAVERHWGGTFEDWSTEVETKATALNLALEIEGREPLPEREIWHLSRSISKWVWTRFTPTDFTTIQRERGYKSGEARRAKNLALILEGINHDDSA